MEQSFLGTKCFPSR